MLLDVLFIELCHDFTILGLMEEKSKCVHESTARGTAVVN